MYEIVVCGELSVVYSLNQLTMSSVLLGMEVLNELMLLLCQFRMFTPKLVDLSFPLSLSLNDTQFHLKNAINRASESY